MHDSPMLACVFSERTRVERGPNQLMARAALRRAEAKLLDLTVSNPTTVGLGSGTDLLAPLALPAGLEYRPSPLGLWSARESIAAYESVDGVSIAPEQVVLTASTSEAYCYLLTLLADPGDAILLPRPSYPLLEHLARFAGVEPRYYELSYDGAWHVDLDSLVRARTPRARAIVAVCPNNPTGSLLSAQELRAMAELGLPLVCDEVFRSYTLGEAQAPATRELLCTDQGLLFSLGGLSKTLGLPQLKLSWMVVDGSPTARSEALERLEILADAYLNVSTPIQIALPELLRRGQPRQLELRERIRANYAALRRATEHSAVTPLHLQGGWTAVLRFPRTRPEDEWTMLLLEQDSVLVYPGWFFDFSEEPLVVVSLIVEPQEFVAAIERIRQRVDG